MLKYKLQFYLRRKTNFEKFLDQEEGRHYFLKSEANDNEIFKASRFSISCFLVSSLLLLSIKNTNELFYGSSLFLFGLSIFIFLGVLTVAFFDRNVKLQYFLKKIFGLNNFKYYPICFAKEKHKIIPFLEKLGYSKLEILDTIKTLTMKYDPNNFKHERFYYVIRKNFYHRLHTFYSKENSHYARKDINVQDLINNYYAEKNNGNTSSNDSQDIIFFEEKKENTINNVVKK